MKESILFLKKIRKKIKITINKIGSSKRNNKLKYDDFSIISNNCFAGLTYEYLDLPFSSPTVGLYFFAPEYIKFIKDLKYYVSLPLIELPAHDSKYYNELLRLGQDKKVLGMVGDVEIVFLHYDSFEDAKIKWEKRCKRINYDKIIYKFCDQNLCTEKELEEFNKLDLNNKICFTAKKYDYKNFIQLRKYRHKEFVKDDVFDYHSDFDVVSYINTVFNDRKKVLHVLYSSNFSGAENVACAICEKLSDTYKLAYCCPDGHINKILKTKNIQHIPIKKLTILNIRKAIKEYNPDIIHAHDFKASCIVSFSGFNGKIVSHIHQIPDWFSKKNIKTLLYNYCTRKIDKIIFVSNAAYESYYFKSNIDGKYKIIYNYVDASKVLELSKETFDKKYDLCFFGRLVREKKPLLFIEIVYKLKSKYKNITACMIGNGPLEEECLKKIKEYNLSKNIELLGFQKNPYKIVKNCGIVVMPSINEGLGLTAIESIILDKVVLNSGIGGLKEIFDNTEFICDTVNDYCSKISNILRNNGKLSLKEKDNILSNYTNFSYWHDSIKDVYEE